MPAQRPDDESDFITVTEATQVGLRDDGSPRYQYRKVRRHRSQPQSLKEFIAALSRVRRRSMTAGQHRALVELLAACGHVTLPPGWRERHEQGDGSGAKRHFDARRGDTFAAKATLRAHKVTVLGPKLTVSGSEGGVCVTGVNPLPRTHPFLSAPRCGTTAAQSGRRAR